MYYVDIDAVILHSLLATALNIPKIAPVIRGFPVLVWLRVMCLKGDVFLSVNIEIKRAFIGKAIA